MSVINKMLRDLDSRQAGQTAADASTPPTRGGLTAGTLAVGTRSNKVATQRSGKPWVLVLMLSLVLVLGAVFWWFHQSPAGKVVADSAAAWPAPSAPLTGAASSPQTPVALAPQSVVSDVVAAPVKVAEAVAAVLVPASPAAPVPEQAAVRSEPSKAAAVRVLVRVPAPPPAVAQLPAKGLAARTPVGQLKEATEFSSFRQAARAGPTTQSMVTSQTRAATPVAAPASAEAPKLRRPVLQEVLSQAQERWNLGGRAEAIALLQAAITRLEQAPAGDSAALAALTREYVRMALAQGQVNDAWAMLSRLELPLAGVADIWALRGNVAQRLGRHPEAVRAYLKSLELRPNEPRWMLGAAVSLAAQGQLTAAADFAEKARLAGGLKPDVANYLRQLGVVIRTD